MALCVFEDEDWGFGMEPLDGKSGGGAGPIYISQYHPRLERKLNDRKRKQKKYIKLIIESKQHTMYVRHIS